MSAITNNMFRRLDRHEAPLTERLANAIRTGSFDAIDEISQAASCIGPLLGALGWREYSREILEALPHFSDEMDLIDLRNMLVSLGYESDAHTGSLKDLNDDLLPVLFEADDGNLFVVLKRAANEYLVYDAAAKTQMKLPGFPLVGSAYVFTDVHASHAIGDPVSDTPNWFDSVMGRFRKLVKHLLAMTLLINVIALLVPLFIMFVYDNVIGAGVTHNLGYLVVGVLLALSAEFYLRVLRGKTMALIAGRLNYLISIEAFKRVQLLAPQQTERSTLSAQMDRLQHFESIRDFFAGPNALLLIELPFILLYIGVLTLLGGFIGLIPLAMLLCFAGFAFFWFPDAIKNTAHVGNVKAARARLMLETFSGLKELKSTSSEARWLQLCRETSGEAMTSNWKLQVDQAWVNTVGQTLATLAAIAAITLGTLQVMAQEMSVGALIAVMAIIWRVLNPLQSLCTLGLSFRQLSQAIQSLNHLMRIKPETSTNKAALLNRSIKGAIEFERVSFRYGPDSDPALSGVSFALEPGELLAITGNNGAGKSSILKLMAGMYRQQGGVIRVDQMDLRQMNVQDLRRVVAYLPQTVSLFHGTVAQNIRLNLPQATEENVEEAAIRAGIFPLIQSLPEGFNTVIGDQTTHQLPGGLMHGIALARAYVRKAPVFLLDEPGSALDEFSEYNLLENVKQMRGRQTVLMVSHDPQHLVIADRVLVLNDGMATYLGEPEGALKALMEQVQ